MDFKQRQAKRTGQRGVSLINVIVAAGVTAVLALAMVNLTSNQLQSVAYLEDKLSQIDMKNLLISSLSVGDACTQTLEGKGVQPSQELRQIKGKDGKIIIDLDDSDLSVYEKLNLNNIRLENVDTPAAADSEGMMTLFIDTERQRSGGGPTELKPVKLTIRVDTDGSGNIATCDVVGDSTGVGSELDRACVVPQIPYSIVAGARNPADVSSDAAIMHMKVFKDKTEGIKVYSNSESNCGFHCRNSVFVHETVYTCDKGQLIQTDRRLVHTRPGSYQGGPEGPNG
jgi:hypothetical protein